MRWKAGEKQLFKDINKSPSIRYPIKVALSMVAHRVSLILQTALGGANADLFGDPKFRLSLSTDSAVVLQHARRLIRGVVDCQSYLEDSIATRNALLLVRSFGAKIWDDSPLHIQQLQNVGPVAARKLLNAGIKSIDCIESTEAHRLEVILNKNKPFGLQLQKHAREFPSLSLTLAIDGQPVRYSDL